MKVALELVGGYGGPVRAPLLPAPERAGAGIAAAIEAVGDPASIFEELRTLPRARRWPERSLQPGSRIFAHI